MADMGDILGYRDPGYSAAERWPAGGQARWFGNLKDLLSGFRSDEQCISLVVF